jgi:hypothetical protein
LKKPTRQQIKRVCVIDLKLVTGDYFGVAQDLSFSKTSFQKILRIPWARASP